MEVVLAIGIVSFAFVGMFGLLPVGVNVFRQSMDNTVGSQIIQRIVNEVQQTDYSTLTAQANSSALRYFDDQGTEVPTVRQSIYMAQVTVDASTALPNANAASANLATVSVKLANNPSHNPAVFGSAGGSACATYVALIARNQ